jgi:hypothetical protein
LASCSHSFLSAGPWSNTSNNSRQDRDKWSEQ